MTNDGNILKIIDENNNFQGTGFLISNKYIITCHHCICYSNSIFAAYKDKKYTLFWDEYFSRPDKDIAILRINDIISDPLNYMKESPPGVDVQICGYSEETIENFPVETYVESKLYTETNEISFKEKIIDGSYPWNKKPKICLRVFKLQGKYELGFGGAPVFLK